MDRENVKKAVAMYFEDLKADLLAIKPTEQDKKEG